MDSTNGGIPPGTAITQLRTIIGENLKLIGTLVSKQMMKQDDKDSVKALAKNVAEKVDQLAKCVDNVSINSLSKMLDQKLANICNTQTMNAIPQPVSYAAAVKLPVKTVIEKKIEEDTMIIKAASPAQVLEVQNLVFDGVKKMRSGKEKQIKINTIIRTKTGAVVKVPKEENLDDLISHFKAIDKLKANSTIYRRKDLQPTGVLKGVSKLTDYTELPSILCKMNRSLQGLQGDIKVIRVLGQNENQDTKDVAIRVGAEVYQRLKGLDRIFTDYNSVSFRDKIFVKQCQNCFHFNPNHSKQDCNKAKHCFCGQTGDHACSKTLKCINCTSHPKYRGASNNHKPNSTDCPLYKQQQEYIVQKTSYGSPSMTNADSQSFSQL